MTEYRFHLQKYRPGSKTVCPECGRKACFTRYIDEAGEISFPDSVGMCDHINSCGYHYTPKEYFRDKSSCQRKIEWAGKVWRHTYSCKTASKSIARTETTDFFSSL